MFVLGIDPGLSTTGYGVIEVRGTSTRAVSVGVIRTDPAAPIAERLLELADDLAGVIADHEPTDAAIASRPT